MYVNIKVYLLIGILIGTVGNVSNWCENTVSLQRLIDICDISGLGQANCIHGLGLVTTVTVLELASRAPGRQRAPIGHTDSSSHVTKLGIRVYKPL